MSEGGIGAVNDQRGPAALRVALARLPRLAAAAASTGTFDADLLDDVADLLARLVEGPLRRAGAAALHDLFKAHLPAAVAGIALFFCPCRGEAVDKARNVGLLH